MLNPYSGCSPPSDWAAGPGTNARADGNTAGCRPPRRTPGKTASADWLATRVIPSSCGTSGSRRRCATWVNLRASHNNPCIKASAFPPRQQSVVGSGEPMRQGRRPPFAPILLMQPDPERGAACVRIKPLPDDLNGDCLATALELQCPGHRLVNRACARRLRVFHYPPITSQTVASSHLHGFSLGVCRIWAKSDRLLTRFLTQAFRDARRTVYDHGISSRRALRC